MENRRSALFDKISSLAIYLAYIVIYTYMVTYQLRIPYAFEMNKTLQNFYMNAEFASESGVNKTFDSLHTIEDVITWTRQVYLARIYSGFTRQSQNKTVISRPYSQNTIGSTGLSRITIRNLKTTNLTDSTGATEFTMRVTAEIAEGDAYDTVYCLALIQELGTTTLSRNRVAMFGFFHEIFLLLEICQHNLNILES